MIRPEERVAIARPVSNPVATVAGHIGMIGTAISMIASVAQVIANMNGMSMGVKNMLP